MLNKNKQDDGHVQKGPYCSRGQGYEEAAEGGTRNVTLVQILISEFVRRTVTLLNLISLVVSSTDAGVQPFAVVIKVFHTFVTNSTVFNFRPPEKD